MNATTSRRQKIITKKALNTRAAAAATNYEHEKIAPCDNNISVGFTYVFLHAAPCLLIAAENIIFLCVSKIYLYVRDARTVKGCILNILILWWEKMYFSRGNTIIYELYRALRFLCIYIKEKLMYFKCISR